MMGRKHREQASLFYEFRLDDMIPKGHLLRRINVFVTSVLDDLHEQLGPFYSDIGRPSIDPELLIRMLIIGYCFGIRSERKLCEEVRLHLAYRWFCRLDLNDAVPHHSTFSENRLNRFRESDILRHIFERVVFAAMEMGLVKGEGFAVDASVMEANASRYHGKAPDELDWTEKQQRKRAVTEYLAALEAEAVADGDAQNDNESGGPEGKRASCGWLRGSTQEFGKTSQVLRSCGLKSGKTRRIFVGVNVSFASLSVGQRCRSNSASGINDAPIQAEVQSFLRPRLPISFGKPISPH